MNQFFYELLPLISFIFLMFLISLVVRSDWKSLTNRMASSVTANLESLTFSGMRLCW